MIIRKEEAYLPLIKVSFGLVCLFAELQTIANGNWMVLVAGLIGVKCLNG